MKKILFIISLGIIFPAFALAATEAVKLDVPFITEIPDGVWTKPWNNACEEAAITSVDQYYQGNSSISKAESKKLMWPLFAIENKMFGHNSNTDATQTAQLANAALNFSAVIKENPTLDEIKNELTQGRPVITIHYGFGLNNPALNFLRTGSSYHMMVLAGFDDSKNEFIVEDTGNPNGVDWRYKYDIILSTLHDYNYADSKADGPARVLFTKSKFLVKASGSNRIYLVAHDTKQYVTHPDLFKKYGWQWSKVKIVTRTWLDSLKNGDAIRS